MTPKLSPKAERLLQRMDIRKRLSNAKRPKAQVAEATAGGSDLLLPPDELERLLAGKTLGRR